MIIHASTFAYGMCPIALPYGAIIFFWIGSHEKVGGHRFFSWKKVDHKNNQEIIGWTQILLKTLYNKIAPEMHIFCAMHIGDVHVSSTFAGSEGEGVITFLIIKWGGGHSNIAKVLLKIHDHPYSKENDGP